MGSSSTTLSSALLLLFLPLLSHAATQGRSQPPKLGGADKGSQNARGAMGPSSLNLEGKSMVLEVKIFIFSNVRGAKAPLGLHVAPPPAATFTVVNQCSYTVWAAGVPGGGQQLDPGQTWTITANPGTTRARVWARTGCNFDGSGHGSCQTGDCGGVLQCTGYGSAPNTLAEYALDQYANQDYYDISIIEGFNVPMDFAPTSGGCQDLRCSASNDCSQSYCSPNDNRTFGCPTGTNYKVTFCP